MLAFSCLFFVVLVGLGEIYCRVFMRINFLGNSRGLFSHGRYGTTYGNTPNFTGISFGETVHIDAEGFRVDPNSPQNVPAGSSAVLVMGDSVAFGPALKDGDTIAGVLRKSLPNTSVHNGAVIGYDTFDYKNAVSGIVSKHPEIKTVLLFFCLNDVSEASAQMIRMGNRQTHPGVERELTFAESVNEFLRSRSKLFLWAKNALVDTRMVYFQSELEAYRQGSEKLNSALTPLVDLDRAMKEKGVQLKVFVVPFEAQLRPESPAEYLQPQKMITTFLTENGVENHDTLGAFQPPDDPGRFFLYNDPAHLSESGTRRLTDFACSKIPECRREQ